MNKDMIVSRVLALFAARFWQMVWIHFIYTVLGVAIFTPLMGVIGHFLLGFSGESVLSDMDILFFILSPAGFFVLIFFAALLITILAFEQASLMLLALGEMRGRHFGVGQALYFTGGNAHHIFRFALRLIVRVLIIVLPFLAVAALIALLLISEYDINYYLSAKPPAFYLTVALNSVVVLAMLYLLIRKLLAWSLALPLVLFSGIKVDGLLDRTAVLRSDSTAGRRYRPFSGTSVVGPFLHQCFCGRHLRRAGDAAC